MAQCVPIYLRHGRGHIANPPINENFPNCAFHATLELNIIEASTSEATSGEHPFMRAAEADARLDEWGVMCPEPVMIESTRNLFMTAYPRMVEILQLLGSSSFMLTPSEADMKGPLAKDIERYLATDKSSAHDRVRLFRLAWDVAISSFGSRQVLYERFFASDPLTRARALAAIYPKSEAMAQVLAFMRRED